MIALMTLWAALAGPAGPQPGPASTPAIGACDPEGGLSRPGGLSTRMRLAGRLWAP